MSKNNKKVNTPVNTSNDTDLLHNEQKYNLIWEKETTGEKLTSAIIPAGVMRYDRQYLLMIKSNLEDSSYKVIPFRTKVRPQPTDKEND